MCLASWRILPSTPVLDTLSDPAKSTRFSLDLGERNNRPYSRFDQSNVCIQPLIFAEKEPGNESTDTCLKFCGMS